MPRMPIIAPHPSPANGGGSRVGKESPRLQGKAGRTRTFQPARGAGSEAGQAKRLRREPLMPRMRSVTGTAMPYMRQS